MFRDVLLYPIRVGREVGLRGAVIDATGTVARYPPVYAGGYRRTVCVTAVI